MGSKKINHGAVSSIAGSDLVLVSSPAGKLQPVAFSDLLSAIRSEIQGGARNLLRSIPVPVYNCKLNDDGSISFLQSNQDTCFRLKAAADMSSLVGQNLTISFDCEGLPSGSEWSFGVGGQNGAVIKVDNGRCVLTYKGSQNTCPSKNGMFMLDDILRFQGDVSAVKFSNFMLERGSVAHDWNLAPEEVLDRLSALESSNSGGGGNRLPLCQLRFKAERRCA